jgi:hypothetical protein
MKKLILVLVILLMGCNSFELKDPEVLTEFFLEEWLSLDFNVYKNTTAFKGDLRKKMDKRYEYFEGMLHKTYRDEFYKRTYHWYGLNAVIDLQLSATVESITLSEISRSDDQILYEFESVLLIDVNKSQEERIQKGTISLIEKSNKWRINHLEIDNNIFEEMYEEEE